MTQELTDAVNDYKDCVKKKAEDIIKTDLPAAILELNDVFKKLKVKNGKENDVHQLFTVSLSSAPNENGLCELMSDKLAIIGISGAKETSICPINSTNNQVIPKESIPCNKYICDMINVIKPYVRRLLDCTNILKMWITYSTPKIEDGNTFGVEVQELVRDKIVFAESIADDFSILISDYFVQRGKIISKVIKYPQVDDYWRAVRELDERKYLQMWQIMSEIRNRFGTLHDVITKNVAKINTPRPRNSASLY